MEKAPGKLIVFEGIDGSGKSTQFKRLTERLAGLETPFRRLNFPRYGEPSSALLTMYLQGRFGKNPGDVNAYAASSFYAVDRIASYLEDWGEYYRQGGLLVTDRYTTSNAIHQGAKLPAGEREEYFRWLFDYEYRLLGLPRPALVIFFDMPVPLSARLLQKRQGESGEKADIHEFNADYLSTCYESAMMACAFDGWRILPCARGGDIRMEEDIAEEVFKLVKEAL